MYDIVMLLPTMNNREKSVKEFLENTLSICANSNICLYIYDSSTNNLIQELVKSFIGKEERYANSIIYYRNDNYDCKTSDLKIVEGLSKIKDLTKYIWICGDGIVPNMETCLNAIKNIIQANVDVIQFIQNSNMKSPLKKELYSAEEYFRNFGWQATSYGSTIINTRLVNEQYLKSKYDILKNTGFLYWNYLYSVLIENDNTHIIVVEVDYFKKNSNKRTNSSYSNGRFFKFWIENWLFVIDSLPEEYNDYKVKVAKDIGIHMKLYSDLNLLLLRGTGNLNIDTFKKYRSDFGKVTEVPVKKIEFYSQFPVQLARLYVKARSLASVIKNRSR